MSVKAWVESHPYQLGGGVFAVGLIILIVVLRSGSSTTTAAATTSAADPSYAAAVVAGNTALQVAQIGAQAQATQTAAGLSGLLDQDSSAVSVNSANIDGTVQLATIAAGSSANTNATAFQIAQAADATAMHETDAQVTIGQFTTQSNNDAAVALAAIGSNQATQLATINGGTSVSLAGLSAGVQTAQIAAGVQTANIETAGAVAINSDNNNVSNYRVATIGSLVPNVTDVGQLQVLNSLLAAR